MALKFSWNPLGLSAFRTTLQQEKSKLQTLADTVKRLKSNLSEMDSATGSAMESKLNALYKQIQNQITGLNALSTTLKQANDAFAAAEGKSAGRAKELKYLLKEAQRSAAVAAALGGSMGVASGAMLGGTRFAGQAAALLGGGLISALSPHGVDLTKLAAGSTAEVYNPKASAVSSVSLAFAGVLGFGLAGNTAALSCAPPTLSPGTSESGLKALLTNTLGLKGSGVYDIKSKIFSAVRSGLTKVGEGLSWVGDKADGLLYQVLGEKNYNKMHEIYDSKTFQYLRGIVSNGLGFAKNTVSMIGHVLEGDFPAAGVDIWKACNNFTGGASQAEALVYHGFSSAMQALGVEGNYEGLAEGEEQAGRINSLENYFRVNSESYGGYNPLTATADALEYVDSGVKVYDTVTGAIKLGENVSNLSEYAQNGNWTEFKGEALKLTGFKSGTMGPEDLTYVNYLWNKSELIAHYKRVGNTLGNISQTIAVTEGVMEGDLYMVTTPAKLLKNYDKVDTYYTQLDEKVDSVLKK